jgi:hypothetical protein
MIAALNPKRYRVEHIFDLSEAILRAKIVLAHALVVHPDSVDGQALGDIEHIADRCTPVIVSPDASMHDLVSAYGGRYVSEPFDVHTFKRAVYRAVSRTQDQRQRARGQAQSGMREVQRVVMLHARKSQAAIMAAVLRNQVGASCEAASAPREVLLMLDDPSFEAAVDCLVADPTLLMSSADGAALAHELACRGIPVIPLSGVDQLDVSSAGQVAWDIAPHVRRTLTARKQKIRAAG